MLLSNWTQFPQELCEAAWRHTQEGTGEEWLLGATSLTAAQLGVPMGAKVASVGLGDTPEWHRWKGRRQRGTWPPREGATMNFYPVINAEGQLL